MWKETPQRADYKYTWPYRARKDEIEIIIIHEGCKTRWMPPKNARDCYRRKMVLKMWIVKYLFFILSEMFDIKQNISKYNFSIQNGTLVVSIL